MLYFVFILTFYQGGKQNWTFITKAIYLRSKKRFKEIMFYMVEKLFCFYIANNVGGLRFYFFLSQRYTEYIL